MKKEINSLVAANSGLKFTESPRWYNGKLWFLDIHDKRIKTVNLSGTVETVVELPFLPNGFGITPEGIIMVGDAFQRKIYCVEGKELTEVSDISTLTTFCLSDGIVDAKGRLYVGDIGYNFVDPTAKPADTCVIVLVKPDGQASVEAENLFFPNGIVITPDGKTLIIGETLGHRLTAFDINEDGTLSNKHVWAKLPPSISPDGICLDAEGCVWCANPEGEDSVVRVRKGGEITESLRVGTHAYAVMLGGPERKHLFISVSDSHDPAVIHQNPSANFKIVEVEVPGAGQP